jgi:hypothetical protein
VINPINTERVIILIKREEENLKEKLFLFAALFVLIGSFVYAADLKKDIVGKWEFDMGGGYMATTEYKANGTFDQVMTGMTISGTYTVEGQKITTVLKGKKIKTEVYTVEKFDAASMTMKRDLDGRIVVYKKK